MNNSEESGNEDPLLTSGGEVRVLRGYKEMQKETYINATKKYSFSQRNINI